MTRVLIIDDEAPIRLLCRVNLEAEGMEVLEAGDGYVGLEQARQDRPDIVLLDVMMPSTEGLDGFQICQRMRRDPELKDIPVIIVSAIAQGMGGMRDKVRTQSGADDFLMKPYNPSDLVDKVRELCGA